MCIRLQPSWTKGYFRLGKALMAQHKYIDAATALYDGCKYEKDGESALQSLFQQAVQEGRKHHQAGR